MAEKCLIKAMTIISIIFLLFLCLLAKVLDNILISLLTLAISFGCLFLHLYCGVYDEEEKEATDLEMQGETSTKSENQIAKVSYTIPAHSPQGNDNEEKRNSTTAAVAISAVNLQQQMHEMSTARGEEKTSEIAVPTEVASLQAAAADENNADDENSLSRQIDTEDNAGCDEGNSSKAACCQEYADE